MTENQSPYKLSKNSNSNERKPIIKEHLDRPMNSDDESEDILNQNIHIVLSELSAKPLESQSEAKEFNRFQKQKAEFKKLIMGNHVPLDGSEEDLTMDRNQSLDFSKNKNELSNT